MVPCHPGSSLQPAGVRSSAVSDHLRSTSKSSNSENASLSLAITSSMTQPGSCIKAFVPSSLLLLGRSADGAQEMVPQRTHVPVAAHLVLEGIQSPVNCSSPCRHCWGFGIKRLAALGHRTGPASSRGPATWSGVSPSRGMGSPRLWPHERLRRVECGPAGTTAVGKNARGCDDRPLCWQAAATLQAGSS